jgi:hypothetical protein
VPQKRKRRPAHRAALDLPYEDYVRLNGGEFCAICGALPKSRRLHRDHDHATGRPRGLLCFRCNRFLTTWMTVEFLRKVIAYLAERAEGSAQE